MYPIRTWIRWNLCILLETREGWTNVSSQNPEQDGSMNHFRTWSRTDLCILLETGAGWIYVSNQNSGQDGSMFPIRTYQNPEQDETMDPI